MALIDRVPAYQGPWLVQQDRQARLALTRAPGGLSGRSWMEEAARDTLLAALWMQRDSTETPAGTALAFAGDGREPCRARDSAGVGGAPVPRVRRHRRRPALPARPSPPALAGWRGRPRASRGPRSKSRRSCPGIRRSAASPAAPPPRPKTDAWLAAAPLAGPLRASCDAACPASPVTCRRAAFLLVDGHPLLAEFGTPSATLIPPETWAASPRGQKALLRVPVARYRFAPATAAEVRGQDACLADALAAEVARYRP